MSNLKKRRVQAGGYKKVKTRHISLFFGDNGDKTAAEHAERMTERIQQAKERNRTAQ